MRGVFLLSFVPRLSSCAASCPVIYSCQPVPAALPTACSGLELFIGSLSARWRSGGPGGQWFPRGQTSPIAAPRGARLWVPPGAGCTQGFRRGQGFCQAAVLPQSACSPPARDARMKERLFLEVAGGVMSFCVALAKNRHLSVFGRDVILQVPVY